MPILLAFVAALTFGVADYCGGRASRVHPSAVVAAIGQSLGLLLLSATVLVVGTPLPGAGPIAWGLVGGGAAGFGWAALYYAYANGAISIVAPIGAVVGAVVPVIAGLAMGERPEPLAYVGIVAAVVGVALVSGAISEHNKPTPVRVMVIAAVAGIGFGVLSIALAQTPEDSGLWPLIFVRVAAVPLLVGLIIGTRARPARNRSVLLLAAFAGLVDMIGIVLFLEALRGDLLSIVIVVTSLYPVSTVALAFTLDRERVNRWQGIGMVMAAAALLLVSLGRT